MFGMYLTTAFASPHRVDPPAVSLYVSQRIKLPIPNESDRFVEFLLCRFKGLLALQVFALGNWPAP
jgi:hypothetical protein